jgi:hypothetical protein
MVIRKIGGTPHQTHKAEPTPQKLSGEAREVRQAVQKRLPQAAGQSASRRKPAPLKGRATEDLPKAPTKLAVKTKVAALARFIKYAGRN